MKGDIIHYTRDALGGIVVIDYRKHRVMTFDSVFEQSKIDRRKPYLPVHEYCRAMLLPVAFAHPAHATILGLGGGVMAGALLHLLPDSRVHAVELRPRVLEVAREYFSLPLSANLTVSIGDAREALQKAPDRSTDLILADLYSSDRMSPTQAQREFIRQSSRVLSDAGWLSINYHRTPDIDGPFFRELRGQFAVLLLFRSKTNNTVIFASKRPFQAFHAKDPALTALEKALPIDWRRLMARVTQLP